MNLRSKAFAAVTIASALVLVAPLAANAVQYYAGARNCSSGYEAQSVSYHQGGVTHYMLSGTWQSRFAPSIPSWGYAYKGIGTQTFADSYIDGAPSNLSSAVFTRCV